MLSKRPRDQFDRPPPEPLAKRKRRQAIEGSEAMRDYRRAQEYLEQLALRTGGRTYLADSFGNLSGAFSKIASELREYYSLGFYPPDNEDAGKLRKFKVRVNKPDVAVKSRDSYVLGDRAKKKGK